MFKKTILSALLVIALLLTKAPLRAQAMDYTMEDRGFIQNMQVQVEGNWYNRAGLESFPATESLGPFDVRADLEEGSTIVTARLFYGFFISGVYTSVEMSLVDGVFLAQIPVLEYPEPPSCIPGWGLGMFILGYDAEGNVVEIDERHYADDGGGDPYAVFVILPHTDPVIESITAPIDPVQVGQPVEISALFNDPDNTAWSAIWFWGDGSDSEGIVEDLTAYGEHVYDEPGVYTIEIAISDDEYCGQTWDTYQYVVVYDPDGGFVTGGGWIVSPPEAYAPDPSLTGKASFGFVSKYLKGANIPSGNTEFQFKVANLNFKSANYQWLVVAGSRAQFKGTGTINGAGDYGFILTALDGSPDGFRIKIWDRATNEVIYDNQIGSSDDSISTTALQGGSIVIHR